MNNHKSHSMTVALVAIVMANLAYADSPAITDVMAQQRYPWNGKVDILYTVTGDIAEEAKQRALLTSLKVTAIDRVANTTYTATQLSGDLSLEEGTHSIVWDMDAEEFSLPFKSSNVVFTVSCETTSAAYCVIDLSGGSNATSYPITYMAEPPSGGFNVDEYKTTKLVLRRIEAGTFIMGYNQTDKSHRVTLTKPFFCGIFEVTQKQYMLVSGTNPCFSTEYGKGDTFPVHYVSYDMIYSDFRDKLYAKTGRRLDFQLPTKAQWEYACRAGTTSTYNNGTSDPDSAKDYMWYKDNSNRKSHPVGTKYANAWGLYDMHGNVWEWCRDLYNGGTPSYGTDPLLDWNVSASRMMCGGCWYDNANRCISSAFAGYSQSVVDYGFGFRLVRILSQ